MTDNQTRRGTTWRTRVLLGAVLLLALLLIGVPIVLAVLADRESAPAGAEVVPERIFMICGNDDGSPGELTGCSIDLDGAYASLGNSVSALTQPLAAPDGTRIVFSEPDGMLVIRHLDGTEDLSLSLPRLSGPLDWSSDGSMIVVSDRSSLVVVDLRASRRAGEPVAERFEFPDGQDVLGIARFSPDGLQLAVGTKQANLDADEQYRILLIDRTTGEQQEYGLEAVERDPFTFTGTFADPDFDSTGERLAWGDGISGQLSVLTLATGEVETLQLAQPPELISGVAWTPDDRIVVGVAAKLLIVDPSDGMSAWSPLPDDWSVTAAAPAFNNDGPTMAFTAQIPDSDALLDLVLLDLGNGSLQRLTSSSSPPPPTSTFPGFPVWP